MGGLNRGKRGGILLASVILLIVALVWLAGPRRKGSFQRHVLLRKAAEIDRILIHDQLDTLWLELAEGQWFLEGAAPVTEVAVENLLYTAAHFEVEALLSELPGKSASGERMIEFHRENRVESAYLLCRVGEQFYLRATGSNTWYRVSLPGYAGLDLEEVFSLEAAHYLDRMLIQLPPSEISWIEVGRKGEPVYRIQMDESGAFSCILPQLDSLLPGGSLDELSLRLLFSYFSAIPFESSASAYPGKLPGKDPGYFLASLRLASARGEEYSMQVYSLPVQESNDDHLFKACVYFNQEPEALIVNYIYLDVLMRPLRRYFGK